jgi:hypothetical protein
VSDYQNIIPPSGKRGPSTYKAAKARKEDHGTFGNRGITKPASKKKVSMADKKVKKVSNKVMGLKGNKNPGPAVHNATQGEARNR